MATDTAGHSVGMHEASVASPAGGQIQRVAGNDDIHRFLDVRFTERSVVERAVLDCPLDSDGCLIDRL